MQKDLDATLTQEPACTAKLPARSLFEEGTKSVQDADFYCVPALPETAGSRNEQCCVHLVVSPHPVNHHVVPGLLMEGQP